jgi:hypothetical protein
MHLSALVVVAAGLAQAGIANGLAPPSLGFPNRLRRDDSVQAVISKHARHLFMGGMI